MATGPLSLEVGRPTLVSMVEKTCVRYRFLAIGVPVPLFPPGDIFCPHIYLPLILFSRLRRESLDYLRMMMCPNWKV